MKKIKTLLTISLIVIVSMTSVFAAEGSSSRQDIEQKVRAMYENDKMFLQHKTEDPLSAEEMIQSIVDAQLENNSGQIRQNYIASSKSYRRPFDWSLGVPVIKQATSYWCGAASSLQALYGMSKEDSVAGGTDDEKQATLWSSVKSDSGTSAVVYKIRNALNSYISSDTYSYKLGSSFTDEDDFLNNLVDSLHASRPPILHAKTEYLSYYNGTSFGHYIAVDGYQYDHMAPDTAELVILSDCNWHDTYRGTFYENPQDVLDSISVSGRYLIFHD